MDRTRREALQLRLQAPFRRSFHLLRIGLRHPPQDDQLSLDEALRLYQCAVDTSRSLEARQAELGGLEV